MKDKVYISLKVNTVLKSYLVCIYTSLKYDTVMSMENNHSLWSLIIYYCWLRWIVFKELDLYVNLLKRSTAWFIFIIILQDNDMSEFSLPTL